MAKKPRKAERNPEHPNRLLGKKKKVLVEHPKIPRKLQKAKSAEAIKFTKEVQRNL